MESGGKISGGLRAFDRTCWSSRLGLRHRRVIVDAAEALAKLEAALLDRFPRQYEYVGEFFLPSQAVKKPKPPEPATTLPA